MSTGPQFPGFDGLFNLSKHEGVDIRPTLLRVLTDLYVQAPAHAEHEKRQFAELASRLIEVVDDATLAAVRAKLTVCPDTPPAIVAKLRLPRFEPSQLEAPGPERPSVARNAGPEERRTDPAPPAPRTRLTIRPGDAVEIDRMFSAATPRERTEILRHLEQSPLVPAVRPTPRRAGRSIEALEMAAFANDRESFAIELASVLLLSARAAARVLDPVDGDALACACKAVGMPSDVFQRVLLFLDPGIGTSVLEVFRLSRLYDVLSDRAALIMVSVWRGAAIAQVQGRHRPVLFDDERRSARPAPAPQRDTPAQPAFLQVYARPRP